VGASNLATLLVKGPAPAHPVPPSAEGQPRELSSSEVEGKGGVIPQRDLCICELEGDLGVACRS
jgi:hypothetical protein